MVNWICQNRDAFIIGIITGIIAGFLVALIGFLIKKLIEIFTISPSDYSGRWQQLIYSNDDTDYSGSPIKVDLYDLTYKKTKNPERLVNNVSGTITRIRPKQNRKWDFTGYLYGDVLTILYQSAKDTQKSRGCIYVRHKQDNEFRGYYLEEHEDGTIDKTPVIIKKLHDSKKNIFINKWR